jgi:signal transduction histidine kinase
VTRLQPAISPLLVQISRVSFLVRLATLLAAMLANVGRPLTLVFVVGVTALALTSYQGLTRPSLAGLVMAHPMLAMLDVLVLFAVLLLTGTDGPLVLATLTTALLIGLWLSQRSAALVVFVLVMGYTLVWRFRDQGSLAPESFLGGMIVPFAYVCLAAVGMSVRKAVDEQQRSLSALEDAVRLASAAEERARFAREIHDSLAKSLQGVSLGASALPTWIERDPAVAKVKAGEVSQAAAAAVDDARVLMSNLRRTTTLREPLPQMLRQVVKAWEARGDHRAEVSVDDVDVAADAHRYELLVALGEALENITRHAGPCRTLVTLRSEGDEAVLTVQDKGRGSSQEMVARAEAEGHFGVRGMRERLESVGGRVSWKSAPGVGTNVTFRVHQEGLVEP